jgi:hypothetical protein
VKLHEFFEFCQHCINLIKLPKKKLFTKNLPQWRRTTSKPDKYKNSALGDFESHKKSLGEIQQDK